jgi:hypothetical protein
MEEFMSQKLQELIIYISKELKDDTHFGSIKLNKILFYSDMIAFGMTGKSITGVEYLKRPFGPAPRGIKYIQHQMEVNGDIRIDPQPVLVKEQKKPIALRDIKEGVIAKEELEWVDAAIQYFKDLNAVITSKISHDFRWHAADMDQVMPMETVFLRPRPLAAKEIEYGLSLASK